MINVGDILSTVGVFSTVGDIMSTVGVMLSAVADTHYRGGYHEYREVFSTVGENIFCYLSTPTVLNTPQYS